MPGSQTRQKSLGAGLGTKKSPGDEPGPEFSETHAAMATQPKPPGPERKRLNEAQYRQE
jgi:hypothetical protein